MTKSHKENNFAVGKNKIKKMKVLACLILKGPLVLESQPNAVFCCISPEGIRRERAVADADLITLLTGREVRFSPDSPESNRCRARRTAKSLVALGVVNSGPSLLLLRVR